jgi:hypothetical protein
VSKQQLSAFVDGALTGVSRELVTRHLAACASCRERHGAWKAADDALRQALAWTPAERTLEEWSSRVEMCLTAERKGLPVPEFTPTLLPVIAPTSSSALHRMRELLEDARAKRIVPREDLLATAASADAASPAVHAPAPEMAAEPEKAAEPANTEPAMTEAEPVHEIAREAAPALAAEPENEAARQPEPTLSVELEPRVEVVAEPIPVVTTPEDVETPLARSLEPETVTDAEAVVEPEAEPAPAPAHAEVVEHEPEPQREPEPAAEIEAPPARDVVVAGEAPRELQPVPVAEGPPAPEPVVEPEVVHEAPTPELERVTVPMAEDTPPAAPEPEPQLAPVAEVPPAPDPVAEPMPPTRTPEEPFVTARDLSKFVGASEPPARPARVAPVVVEPAPRLTGVDSIHARMRERTGPRRRKGVRRLIAACAVLVAVLLTSVFMPEVIRIPVPESWLPRVPRVEFVRRGARAPQESSATREPGVRLASRQPLEPEVVPQTPRTVPADSTAARHGATEPLSSTPAAADSTPAPEPVRVAADVPGDTVTSPAPAKAAPAPKRTAAAAPAPKRTTSSRPAKSATATEPPAYVPDQPVTIIPVRVTSTVRLSNPPATKPAEPERDEALPLLCGVVRDTFDQPVEGALVQLLSPSLTVRTDRRGRFCVACPAGTRLVRVMAPGFHAVERSIELPSQGIETRISLQPAR